MVGSVVGVYTGVFLSFFEVIGIVLGLGKEGREGGGGFLRLKHGAFAFLV